ncbi:DUF1491 family protein [uncultured Sphingomonas sp.]|uniref:DUF1491 family protein n=1 Tax=uncultured Sphingomonas sp. TaxID=158754 RepID=UPI0025E14AAB|nr:DUF1491 family protein [uncultured Sphingomonas sp.]
MSATQPDRLAPGLEVASFLRLAEAHGGFGMVLHKGDESRGSLLLVILERGRQTSLLERSLGADGVYDWTVTGPREIDSALATQYVARRSHSDPDCWVIELDIPHSERFIAETIGTT